MGIEIVATGHVIQLVGVTVRYSLTPSQAVELLPGSLPMMAEWPRHQMHLWNGDKKDTVSDLILPILWDRQSSNTTLGRQRQAASGIGFAWPVELAALGLPENQLQGVRHRLFSLGIEWLHVLRPKDEDLCCVGCSSLLRQLLLVLYPNCFWFILGFVDDTWGSNSALVGAPVIQ